MNEVSIVDLSYLDALPTHPQPERLESLSSYIMRLAEANGFDEIRTLYKLMSIHINKAEDFDDFPRPFFAVVALRAACSEQELLATTLYHAGKKFGRSAQTNALSRFFHSSLGEYLRYCPSCLSKLAYYPLTWRFLALTGCHLHHCRFLDRCGYCGGDIPLFAIPAKMGVCPHCHKALHGCEAEMLSRQEQERVQQRTVDLEYLLSPQSWEERDELARTMGWRLRKIREEKQCTVEQIAVVLAESVRTIRELERGTKDKRSPLQVYLRYVDYFGIPLHTIFTDTYNPPPKHRLKAASQPVRFTQRKFKQTKPQQDENDLLEQVQKVIEDIRELGAPFNLGVICRRVHKSLSTLKEHPSTKALLEQVSDELRQEKRDQRRQLEDEVLRQVQQAILDLSKDGSVLCEKAICEYVQRPTSQLRRFPRVNMLLKQTLGRANSSLGQIGELDERLVVERVSKTIADLEASGQSITWEKISSGVDMSLHTLQQYPQVKKILEQVADHERLHRRKQSHVQCQKIIEQVREALEQLRESRQSVSRKAVAELVGMNVKTLEKYAPVRALLAEVVVEYWFNGPQRTQQRESELIEQVRRAMEYLRENGQRITQRAVGKLVGFSDSGLTYYSEFRQLYHQVIEERIRVVKQQVQQREDALIERIDEAIQQLQEQKKPLTLQNIATIVGMTKISLRRYPRIDSLFRHLLEDRKGKGEGERRS